MKCELCQINEVTRAIRKVTDGCEQDVFVCNNCALVEESGYTAAEPMDRFSSDAVLTKVPNVHVFMDATIKVAGLSSGKRCPECGFTIDSNESFNNLRCPVCYKTFAREIAERNLVAGYRGKEPVKGKPGVEIVTLKSQIANAVREKRFDDVFPLKLALEDAESRLKRLKSSDGEA